jgi:PAS domain S-box-containing protein
MGREKAEYSHLDIAEMYREVCDNSPVGICLTDREGIYRYVNSTYCEIYGYSQEELLGRPFYEMIMARDPGSITKEKHGDIFISGRPIPRGETEFVRRNGEKVWIEYSGDFVRRNGKPLYLISMNIDISERKKAELALRQSEEKYRLLVENTGELILSVDEEGNILLVNSTASRYLGGSPEEFIGRKIWDLLAADNADRYMELIRRAISRNLSFVNEEAIDFGGEKRWFRTSIFAIRQFEPGRGVAQILAHDITEEKLISFRDSSRMRLLERLRNCGDIDECLRYGCDAVYESMLFKQSLFALRNDRGEIDCSSQRGYESRVPELHADQIDKILADNNALKKFKISRSLFIPAEAVMNSGGGRRGIYPIEAMKKGRSAWKPGDNLIVPAIGDEQDYIGWLSVETPFNGKRPVEEAVVFLEEIVNITTQHVREIGSHKALLKERKALEDKNITLQEIMANIEQERSKYQNKLIEDLNQSVIPVLDRLVKKNGTVNLHYYRILRQNLEGLAEKSGLDRLNISRLSAREIEICELIRSGDTNREIAKSLRISEATVKKHRESIRRKLGITRKNVNLFSYLQQK